MWLVVAFDIPVLTPEDKKFYRDIKKLLAQSGFSSHQKSLACRWCQSSRIAQRIREKLIRIADKKKGNIMIMQIPDHAFQQTCTLIDGNIQENPEPPTPWCLIS